MPKAKATTVTSVLVAVLALTGVAHAHGGAYRGPSGSVPPGNREPTDAPPPPPGRGADTGHVEGTPRVIAGFEDWAFWWERRRDAVLDGAVAERRTALEPDEVRRWVVPALRRLLRAKDMNFDISSAAAIALARIGDVSSTEFLTLCATDPRKAEVHRVLEETSALALGFLDDGKAETTRALREIRADPDRDAAFVRPFSALALAVREQDGAVGGTPEALISGVWSAERKWSVRPANIVALGVIGDASCQAALAEVVSCDAEDPRSELLRQHDVAAALAALGVADDADAAVDDLLRFLDRNESHALRREAVLAAGAAASRAGHEAAARALPRLMRMLSPSDDPDAPRPVAAEHVVQAIGRIAESGGAAGDAARAFLVGTLRTLHFEEQPSVRANAAVCLGLAVRATGSSEPAGMSALRARFAGTTEPQERSAYALALGLVGDHEAVPALRAVAADGEVDGVLRGYCALALGFLGSGEDEIVAVAREGRGYEGRLQAHLALGLLGGERARATSLAVLTDVDSDAPQWELGAAAWALGANADMDAIAALVALAEDRGEQAMDLLRALAVTAVGRACARPGAPTLDAVRDAMPYRVLPPALLELLTIL